MIPAKENTQSTSGRKSNSIADNRPGESLSLPAAHGLLQKKIAEQNTTGMPDNLKAGIENLSGMDMSDVQVHYHSYQPAQLNALAYAQGTDIHVAPGQEKHLPHEAWHVVQQKQGRVQPTVQMKAGVPVNDDPVLEQEADVMGSKAVQFKEEDIPYNRSVRTVQSKMQEPPVQRLVVFSGSNPPKDANVVATLPDTERSAGGPVVHESANPDYSKSGTIALLAHGGQGSIDWKGGSWNGNRLVRDELNAVPVRSIQAGSTLELWSCSAGERTGASTNDSLVDAVKNSLIIAGKGNIIVKGVRGSHIVLNDKGDHYVPDEAVPWKTFVDNFLELRAYYLWLNGFFSNNLIRAELGGFEQKRLSVKGEWHPVLIPKDMKKANTFIDDLSVLYAAEKKCGGIEATMEYKDFLSRHISAWQKMSSFLRTNDVFKAITKKVEADWLELKS